MNQFNPVVWFEIYVDDIARAQKFYEEVFQFQLDALPSPTGDDLQMMAFPSPSPTAGGAAGALVKMAGVSAGQNSTMVYFGSEDCSVEEARVEAAGGKVITPKTSLGPHGFMVMASDTEGNMIGIHSMA